MSKQFVTLNPQTHHSKMADNQVLYSQIIQPNSAISGQQSVYFNEQG
jgi:hypothetical protein